MARPNPIRAIMESELPTVSYQRRKLFRPTYNDTVHAYKLINRYLFDNCLLEPEIVIKQTKKCWAYCEWHYELQESGSYCTIRLNDKWFCPQWFVNTLAHEMVHQYQWDIWRWTHSLNERSGAHGPSFFAWRDRFAEYGLTLKTAYGQRRWFKYQRFDKC